MENGFGFAAVKVAKRDEIIGELEQVAIIPHEFFDHGNGAELGFEGFIAGNQRVDVGPGGAGEEFADPRQPEFFDGPSRFGRDPRFVSGEFLRNSRPI